MEKEVLIKPTFDVKSSLKASLNLLVGRRFSFSWFFALLILISHLFIVNFTEEKINFTLLIPLVVILLLPFILYIIMYRAVKKSVLENPRLKENIIYTINKEFFQEKGDTFEIKHFWKNIIKVENKKDFILLYLERFKAIVLKKSDLKNNQYQELIDLINFNNVKNNFKK